MALDAEKRIPDTTLPANSFKDGDILYGLDMNRVVDTLKTAVNENYKDLKGAVKGGDSIYINPIEGVVDAEGQPIDTVDGLIKWLYDNKILNEGKIYSLRINDSKQFEYYDGESWKIATVGQQGEPGEGVPAGGLSGQFLRKQSDVSYDTEWVDAYDKPQVDSKLNNLTTRVTTNTNDIARLNKFSIITLGTSWTQDTTNGYYTQTVALSGITSNDNPVIDIVLSNTLEEMQTQQEEWGKILKVETSDDGLTFYASETTTTALNLILKMSAVTKSDANDIQTELTDIRVGYDGTAYDSAGDAVRTQVSELKSDLSNETIRSTNRENEIESLFTMPTQDAVNNWLNDHPEATTTVQDHSLTIDKMVVGTLGYVTPEMFGAIGDGVEDDTQALSEAFNSNEIVYLKENATYAVTGSIKGSVKHIVGNGAKIVLKNSIDTLFSVDNIDYIDNIEIDCNNNGIRFCIVSFAKNPTIKNVTIHSIRDMRSDNYTICIGLYNAYSVMLDGINVHDCRHVINGNIGDANGNISAIYVENWTNTCTIKNSIFSEIHNINSNGEIAFEDSNGIYARSVLDGSYLIVDNVYCKNGGKRLIKTQCLNVSINNVNGYFDAVDNLSIISISSLEDDSGRVAKATISNCNLNSKHTESINCYLITSSEYVVISNCILTTNGNNDSILNTRKMIIESCLFSEGGLVNNGVYLGVNNSTFRNVVRNTHYSTHSKNLKDVTFDCCTFEDCSNFTILAESIVSNCKFYGTGITQSGGNAILTDCSMYKQSIDSITILSGNMKAINIKSIADAENTTRCINLKSEASLDIDGLYTEKFSYSIIGNGNVKARNIDVSMVLGNNFASYSNEPPYVDALPPKANLIPNGTLCILKTDGRLYKTDNKAWVAVN